MRLTGKKEVTAVAADGDVEDLVTAEDGTMVPLRGMGDENLAQKIQTIKMGGIYSELLLSAQWTAQLLDEASGMGAPQRGELQGGDPTATEGCGRVELQQARRWRSCR